ncbi:Hypothetical predicted protein [Mytilus galloprovincialis]|uniref:Farnesoic acid O-methyl transferase domain-containing protein n=1 Tax=Mytilus galloprovincialis TaxID=29158 RepID=A0A8B6HJS5_MYTGA|nr:Hypothetical predicted protein [Mytilus galloprovincialis]
MNQPFSYSVLNKQPISTSEQSSLVLSVTACEHARIIFAENVTFRPSFEAIIRRLSTKSRIRKCSEFSCSDYNQMDWVEENDTLSCEEFRTFWLSWNGSVTIGKGYVIGLYPFITSNKSQTFNIQFIGLLTESGSSDSWTFDKETNPSITTVPATRNIYTEIENITETTTSIATFPVMQTISLETTHHTSAGTSSTKEAVIHEISMQTKYYTETITNRITLSSTQIISLATANYTATSKTTTTVSPTEAIPRETTVLTNTGIMATEPCICSCAKVTKGNPFAYLVGLNLSKTELVEELREHMESLTRHIKINAQNTSFAFGKKDFSNRQKSIC